MKEKGINRFIYRTNDVISELDICAVHSYQQKGYVSVSTSGGLYKSRYNYDKRKGYTYKHILEKESFYKVLKLVYTDHMDADNEGRYIMTANIGNSNDNIYIDVFVDSVLLSCDAELKRTLLEKLKENNIKHKLMMNFIFVQRDNYDKYGRKEERQRV